MAASHMDPVGIEDMKQLCNQLLSATILNRFSRSHKLPNATLTNKSSTV